MKKAPLKHRCSSTAKRRTAGKTWKRIFIKTVFLACILFPRVLSGENTLTIKRETRHFHNLEGIKQEQDHNARQASSKIPKTPSKTKGNAQKNPSKPFPKDSTSRQILSEPTQMQMEDWLESRIEDLLEVTGEEASLPSEDWEELLFERQTYRENPLNLNTANAEELRRLQLLDEWQIQALLHYRESYGRIVHWNELTDFVPGFSAESLALLQAFFFLGPESDALEADNLLKKGKHQILARYNRRLKPSKAFREGKYAGSPDNYYLRYLFNAQNRIRIGFSAQQDAGEAFGRQGFDFYAGYMALSQIGTLQNLVIGTYRANWGFGLHIGSGGGFYGGTQADLMLASGQGIRPFASGAEYGFLQGAAAEFRLSTSWKTGLLYSGRKRDGRFRLESPSGSRHPASILDQITSLPQNGYHRTETEIAGKQSLREQLWAWKLEKDFRTARIGLVLSTGTLGGIGNPELKLGNGNRTPLSHASAHRESAASLYYQWLIGRLHLYGEASMNFRRDYAFLQGVQWKPSENFALAARYTHYSPTYFVLYGDCPLSRPMTNPKEGKQKQRFEWQMLALLPKGLRLELDGDLGIERKALALPVQTYSLAGKLAYSRSSLDAYLQFSYGKSLSRQGHSFRADFSYLLPLGFFGESRVECRNFTDGLLLMQDFGYATPDNRLKFRFRLAVFQTKDYMSRIYAYEHDVLYGSSISALYGKGLRFAFNCRYEAFRWLILELKYAHTLQDGVQKMGSGDNETEGYLLPEIKLQVRLKF